MRPNDPTLSLSKLKHKRCNTPAPIFPCNPDQPVRSGLIGVPYGGLADILTLQRCGHFNVYATLYHNNRITLLMLEFWCRRYAAPPLPI